MTDLSGHLNNIRPLVFSLSKSLPCGQCLRMKIPKTWRWKEGGLISRERNFKSINLQPWNIQMAVTVKSLNLLIKAIWPKLRSGRVSLRSCYLSLQKLWPGGEIIFLDIGLENKNRNKRVYPNKNTASWHTHTDCWNNRAFLRNSGKHSPVSLINHIICGLRVNPTCTPASPGEHFWDSSLPFDLSSLPSVQKTNIHLVYRL